jgi:predicted choloylglycine hydrolase
MPDRDGERQAAGPASWQDWQRWVEETDWTDWRSWLTKAASTDWASAPWPSAPWDQAGAVPTAGISLTLRAFEEAELGEHLTAVWPAFRQWWQDGPGTRPTAAQTGARLDEHMPELVPAWRRLAEIFDNDREAAAALGLWNPPPFLTGCSQAAVLPGGPALIRNYDWDHRLFDAAVAGTAFTGRRVLGMLDCLWGLLDGVNDAGLAVSLAFGGRPQVGEGFGIPLVIRYVLETCGSTEEAMRTLRRLPVHMSYNVTAVDRDGRRATAYLAPDRPAQVTSQAVATNHQGQVEWAPYAAAIRTVERKQHLQKLLDAGGGAADVVAECLRPPLYATRFGEGFGTLYTAEYRPAEGVAAYHWPGRVWEHSLERLGARSVEIRLGGAQAPGREE